MLEEENITNQEIKGTENPEILGKKAFFKRKIFIIVFILIILCVLILISYIFFFKGKGGFDELYDSCLENCDNIKLYDSCKINCRDLLNYRLAIENKDISFCSDINDESKRELCKESLILEKAKEQKNPDLCSELENSSGCKDSVNMNIAISNMDYSFCEKIIQEDKKSYCLMYVVSNKAIIENDVNICENLNSENEKVNCKNYFYYINSINDKQLCEKISDKTLQNSCELNESFSVEVMGSMGMAIDGRLSRPRFPMI